MKTATKRPPAARAPETLRDKLKRAYEMTDRAIRAAIDSSARPDELGRLMAIRLGISIAMQIDSNGLGDGSLNEYVARMLRPHTPPNAFLPKGQ